MCLAAVVLALVPGPSSSLPVPGDARAVCVKDVDFALEALEKKCGQFFELKKIDWKKVSEEFKADAKKVKDEGEHYGLLIRLLARLHDGHSNVKLIGKGASIKLPDGFAPQSASAGFTLCRSGGKLYLKSVFGPALKSGYAPGMEVTKLGKLPAAEWLAQRVKQMSDISSYSTEQQAFYFACNYGPMLERGKRLDVDTLDGKGRKLSKALDCDQPEPWLAPAFPPEKLEGAKPVCWGKSPKGFGYLWLHGCPDNLPSAIDPALEKLGDVAGMIVDFRGNGGGGFDHEDFLGRFLPQGATLPSGKGYKSSGEHPYGGPVVVIVDAGVRSAAETGAGMFKEDGRGWMIGESATAGMSSSKETIELPSGLFALYVSVGSNKGRFNKGAGIEGIGVPPNEIVEYDPKDLAAGVDTLIKVAEERLANFPQDKVRYDPAKAGWKPAKK